MFAGRLLDRVNGVLRCTDCTKQTN